MQLIIVQGETPIAVIELPDEDADLGMLLQMIQAECQIPVAELTLSLDNAVIHPIPQTNVAANSNPFGTKLTDLGIVDGVSLSITRSASQAQQTQESQNQSNTMQQGPSLYTLPGNIKPDELMELTKTYPRLLMQFKSHDEELGKLLEAQDLGGTRMLMMRRSMNRHKTKYDEQQDLMALARDPENPELQKKIEEKIRLENIQENMTAAMESFPEAFGRVTMLYVPIEVNNHPIKAFVDSGAQSTIMSAACAERCNITRLIDVRFAGEARGVGTAKILGKVHIAQMKFGNSFFSISITILDNSDVDFLFGLDTLRRYRCVIDLIDNCLRIDGSTGAEKVEFLPENQLPENAKNHSKTLQMDG